MNISLQPHLILFPLLLLWGIFPFLWEKEYFLTGSTATFICFTGIFLVAVIGIRFSARYHFRWADGLFLFFIVWWSSRNGMISPTLSSFHFLSFASILLLYGYGRNLQHSTPILTLLFLSGLLQAFISIFQAGNFFFADGPPSPIRGYFSHPAELGIFLTLSVLSGGGLLRSFTSRNIRLLLCFGLLLQLVGLYLSASRAAWLACAVGFIWMYHSRRYNPLLLLPTILFLLAGGIWLYFIRPESVQGRFLIWQVIADHLSIAPLTGQGSLQALYMPMQGDWLHRNPDSSLAFWAGNNLYAFNETLRIFFESGLLGLAGWITLIVIGIRNTCNKAYPARQFGGLWLALLVFSCFSYPFSMNVIAGTTVFLFASMVSLDRSMPLFSFALPRYGKWSIGLACCLFYFLSLQHYQTAKQADHLLQEAQYRPEVLDNKRLAEYYSHLSDNPDFVLAYGKTLFNHARYREAIPVLEQARRLKPSTDMLCDLGYCYETEKRYPEAIELYTQASRMIPTRIYPHYHLFCLYRDREDIDQAVTMAQHILTMPVKIVNTSVLRIRHEIRTYLNHLPRKEVSNQKM